jgi:hypothetical protein
MAHLAPLVLFPSSVNLKPGTKVVLAKPILALRKNPVDFGLAAGAIASDDDPSR